MTWRKMGDSAFSETDKALMQSRSGSEIPEAVSVPNVTLVSDRKEDACINSSDSKELHHIGASEDGSASTTPDDRLSGEAAIERLPRWKRLVRYLQGEGSAGHTSLAQNYSLWWTLLVAILLIGNAALFIWSNTRCARAVTCACVYFFVVHQARVYAVM